MKKILAILIILCSSAYGHHWETFIFPYGQIYSENVENFRVPLDSLDLSYEQWVSLNNKNLPSWMLELWGEPKIWAYGATRAESEKIAQLKWTANIPNNN